MMSEQILHSTIEPADAFAAQVSAKSDTPAQRNLRASISLRKQSPKSFSRQCMRYWQWREKMSNTYA